MSIVIALLRLGLVTGGLLTLAGLLAPIYPPLELVNHFRPAIVLGCIGLAVLQLAALSAPHWRVIGVLAGLNLALLILPVGLEARTSEAAPRETLSVLSLNVWANNRRIRDVAEHLNRSGADIVVLQELPRRNADVLLPLVREAYPYQVVCNRCRNLALLSKRPWRGIEEHPASSGRPGMIMAEFGSAAGAGFRLVVLHPNYPLKPFEQARDYRWLTSWLSKQRGPLIVAGDFNLTPWAWKMMRLQAATGLVRHGTWQTSWSGHHPLQAFLIDNVLTTPDIRAVSFATGPGLGSDHLPVIATLALP